MRHWILAVAVIAQGASAQYFRGVNIAGAEFGADVLPGIHGVNYWYNSAETFRYFASKGLNVYRLCLRWERLQQQLQGPLDAENVGYLKQDIAWAKANQAKVILDIHNYGRYKLPGCPGTSFSDGCAIDEVYEGRVRVSTNDLVDLWTRLSAEFKDEPAVYAYNMMNEPHDMGAGNWKVTSQAVLSAIRNNGDSKLVLVPGDSWSGARQWRQVHGPQGWISDPAGNFLYEAHQYFDADGSGTYRLSYEEELARNRNLATVGRDRVRDFVAWCRDNGARGSLGEYGVPDNDPRWRAVLDDFLAALDEAGIDGAYWAAGEWWGTYALSVQPRSNFTADRPQLPILTAHSGAAFLWSVSAGGAGIATVTPNGLAAGYGTNLVPDGAALADVELAVAGLPASAIYAGPTQINYAVPAGVAEGWQNVTVSYRSRAVAGGTVQVERLSPSLFAANGNGQGVAAAELIRVKDGAQTFEPVARYDPALGRFVGAPIRFGETGESLYVAFYGTGLRAGSSYGLRIGTQAVNVTYFGAQPTIPGLDQVNVELPRSLAGAGEVEVRLVVEGRPANPITLAFQ